VAEVTELGTATPVLDEGDALVDWLAPCEVGEVTELVSTAPGIDEDDTRVDWLALFEVRA